MGFLSLVLMLFSLNSEFFQATPSTGAWWSHISSILNIFNILSGWEDSITKIQKKDSVFPLEAPDIPLLAKWVGPLTDWRQRSWSGCQVARDLFKVQISDFWYVLWNCDRRERRQTKLMGQWGFQRAKAVEFIPKLKRGHEALPRYQNVNQKKPFILGKKKCNNSQALFAPSQFYSLT